MIFKFFNKARQKYLITFLAITVLTATLGVVGMQYKETFAQTIETKNIVDANEVSVSTEASGAKIISDEAYDGSIKGIFKGDLTLKFSFTETLTSWFDGDFKLRISDLTDAEKYFDIEYVKLTEWQGANTMYGYTGAFVKYKEEIRSSKYYQGDTVWYNKYEYGESAICGPTFRSSRTQYGILQLVWEGDILKVKVNRHDDTSMRTIAAFDGTTAFVSGQSWNLPKIDFVNGYTITFSSDFSTSGRVDSGTDVRFEEITAENGNCVFGTQNIEEPEFYKLYQETPIVLIGETETNGTKGKEIVLPTAEVIVNGERRTPYKITLVDPDDNREDITGELCFTPQMSGNYNVIYQGVETYEFLGEGNPNLKTIKYVVYELSVEDLWSGLNETAIRSAYTDKTLERKGQNILFEAENTVVKMNTVFLGDFTLDFQIDSKALCDKATRTTLDTFNTLTYRFRAINSGDWVDFVFYSGNKLLVWEKWYSFCYIKYGNEKYATSTSGDYVYDSERLDYPDGTMYETAGITDVLCQYHPERTSAYCGNITFDVETMSFFTTSRGSIYKVASFSETKYNWSAKPTTFEEGYTVEIIASGAAANASVSHYSLNGLDLSGITLPTFIADTESYVLSDESDEEYEAQDKEYIDTNGVQKYRQLKSVKTGYETGLNTGIDKEYTVKDSSNNVIEDFRLKRVGTYTLTYNCGAEKTVRVIEDVTPPTILPACEFPSFVKEGEAVQIAKSDIVATDALDGIISAEMIKIKIGKTETFSDYSEDYSFTKGEYIIRYTAIDNNGNEGVYDRELYIADGRSPTITLSGTVATNAFSGKEITLPIASAKIENEKYDVYVSVSTNGNAIMSMLNGATVNKFKAQSSGEYRIVYYSKNADGIESSLVYILSVEDDVNEPMIQSDCKDIKVKKGETVVLPTATAEDNADGQIAVNKKVYFGTKEIEIKDNKFVASEYGTYRVVYTSTDRVGNEAEKSFVVTVVATEEETKKGCGAECCGNEVAIIMIIGAAIINITKKRIRE